MRLTEQEPCQFSLCHFGTGEPSGKRAGKCKGAKEFAGELSQIKFFAGPRV